MSRIRSVHPGLYTDEAWAQVSIAARWLAVGLMTEADDNGVFEWKPIQIKMRVYPVDTVDVPALLAELVAANIIRRFEIGDPTILARHGRKPVQLGAIRNFGRYQKPRKPKAWQPITPDIQRYVGLDPDTNADDDDRQPSFLGSEPPSDEQEVVPTNEERAVIMEDGGWMRDEGGGKMEEGIPHSPPISSEPFTPPEPEWSEFIAFRKRIRAPFTEHARKLAITALKNLVEDGNDPREVINRSILNGWKGLFQLPEERAKPKRPTRPAVTAEPITQVNGEDPQCAAIRERILETIGAPTYTSHFQDAHLIIAERRLQLEFPSSFRSDWCRNNYGEILLGLIPEGIETIHFTVSPNH